MKTTLRRTFLLAPLLLAGCMDVVPTSPGLQQRVFSVLGGLEVGEVLQLTGVAADTIFLPGATAGSEFVVVPFFASEAANARLQVEIAGGRVSVGDAALARGASASPLAGGPRPDDDFHIRRLAWETATFSRLLRDGGAAAARARMRDRVAGRAQAAPVAGELITVRVPNFTGGNPCTNFATREARVEAVSNGAIVVADVANPQNGLTSADYQSIAREYDEWVHPVTVENFGEPTDLDNNGHVIILITSSINERTVPGSSGVIVGTTFLGDLLIPDLGIECPSSNLGEIFYIIAPDPEGTVGPRISERFVTRIATTIVIHELQHLVNFGRRLFVNQATELEAVWLNEALSHMSEELLFYATTPFEPRQNITLAQLNAAPADAFERFVRFQSDNLVNYFQYMEHPSAEALLGEDAIPTRGAGWAFLRYAADQEEGDDSEFFFSLVNSKIGGIPNLDRSLEDLAALDLMQSWTASVFADDFVPGVEERYEQPSWNYRTLPPLLSGNETFPLEVRQTSGTDPLRLTLEAGGSAFVRVSVEEGEQSRIRVTSASAAPPGNLRVSVIRTR